MSTKSGSLRVLFVAARYLPYVGGLETHVYEVGRRLTRANIDVSILTTDVSGRLPVDEESEGMHIRRVRAWPTNKDYYFSPQIYPFITGGSWDLVHCQGYHNLVPPLAMFAAWRAHIPFVLSFHSGGDVTRLRKALRGLQWTMLRPLLLQAQKLIAVSEFEARYFQEQLHLRPERIVIIPNGAAHLPEVPESAIAAAKEASDTHLIVSIGRLERYKGHQRLIAALPKVLEHMPDAHLRIVGIGPYESTLQKMARRLGVAGHVDIRAIPPGDGHAMAALLARANLVTLLSEHEAQGLAVMEALTLKRPVLVAGTSALQELANSGLVRAVPLKSNPEEVAMAVVSQLRHPFVPQDVTLPTWDACATHLLALYQEITWRVSCAS
jgi:glycosyltransferase involved in cell wall biosynthesis